MRNLIIVLCSFLSIFSFGQNQNTFTFPELDGRLISIWSSAHHERTDAIAENLESAMLIWQDVRQQICRKHIVHFSHPDFITEQEDLLDKIGMAIQQQDLDLTAYTAYEILKGFREVRFYFTGDLYPLDELMVAYERYQELHYAVDDPMLGLYEWKQFVRLLADFRHQFNRYLFLARPGFDAANGNAFDLMLQRVLDCAKEFENSLQSAMQDEFVVPCDDTNDALLELIEMYGVQGETLQ